MELSTKKQIVLEAKIYIKENNISQTDLAVKADVRKEYMSNMFKYNSDFTVNAGNDKTVLIPDKYFDRVAKFIGYSYTKTFWDNQPTTQFINVIAHLQNAKDNCDSDLIIGETGCGKTHSINLFHRKNIYPVGSNFSTCLLVSHGRISITIKIIKDRRAKPLIQIHGEFYFRC